MFVSKAKALKNKAKAIQKKAQTERKIAQATKDLAKAEKIKARAIRNIAVSESELVKDILREAKSLGIEQDEAKIYVKIVARKVSDWANERTEVTRRDIDGQISKDISKYNADLAFIYKNRGKII